MALPTQVGVTTPQPLVAVPTEGQGSVAKPQVISQEDYVRRHSPVMGEAALHRMRGLGKNARRAIMRIEDARNSRIVTYRQRLREEYDAKVAAGEIRPPTHREVLIEAAQGHPDNESTQAARRLLKKYGQLLEPLEPRTLASAAPYVDLATHTVYSPRADGTVEVSRWTATGERAGSPVALDAGSFDVWFRHVGTSTEQGSDEGDFNNNGIVDASDFDVWFRAVGETPAPVIPDPVPEPLPGPAYDWHRETVNGVVNVWAPNPYDFGQVWTISVTSTNWRTLLYGADGVPNLESIAQGPAADCYFLAGIGSLAFANPAYIQTRIGFDGYGFTVRWEDVNTHAELVIHTPADFSAYWQPHPSGELWWMVMEKSYATFRTWNGFASMNTMLSTGWGFSAVTVAQAGADVRQMAFTVNAVEDALAAGKGLSYHTASNAQNLVASHVYVITGLHSDSAGLWVTLYNPWGFYDARSFSEVAANGIGSFVIGSV